MSKRARVWRELPLVGGILMGWILLWWRGRLLVLGEGIEGYGWPGYFLTGWATANDAPRHLDYFRQPLHGLLLGHLGEAMGSYADAAVIIASLSAMLLVASAGLGARLLSGPFFGGLAAAALPLTANTADAARWANNYTLLAALTGATVVSALALARRPRPALALATGSLLTLSLVADTRAVIAIPPVAILLVLALSAARHRRGLLVLLFAAGLLIRPLAYRAAGRLADREMPMAEKLSMQREVVSRWVESSRDPALLAGCSVPKAVLLSRDYLGTDCPQAMLRHNLTQRLPAHAPFGVLLTGLGAAALLLPDRRGWRGSAEGAAVLSVGIGVAALAVLTPLVDRYMLQFSAFLAMIPPAGAGRLLRSTLPRALAKWAAPVVAIALGAWVWRSDPPGRDSTTALQRNTNKQRQRLAAEEVRRRLGRDDVLMDCSGSGVSLSLLPRVPHAQLPQLHMPFYKQDDDRFCQAWISNPPDSGGAIYLATDADHTLRSGEGRSGGRVDLPAVLEADERWEAVWKLGGFVLWQRR